jgi:SAM-dependent methyltransferase
VPVHRYDAAPAGEVRFALRAGTAYHRELFRCDACGHFLSRHAMDLSDLYSGGYVDATYGGAGGLRRNFERIITLPPERSDNAGRVARIVAYAESVLPPSARPPSILDVGSGLGVFAHRMKQAGWRCAVVDPDPRNASHARETVGVEAHCGDFMKVDDLGRYDAISFNKVLEHVEEPVAMLRRAASLLEAHGFVYIELPDGEGAAEEGFGREEFFIDHLHVFSAESFAALVRRAGFRLDVLERIREPSAKFTLRGFVRPA